MTKPTFSLPATALITGASSGLGLEMARQLAARGANLILVARSEAALQTLAQELHRQHGVQVTALPADLAAAGAAGRLMQALDERGLQIDLLVNNAGFGLFGEFVQQSEADIERMIQLNITTLTQLTRLCLPGMLERGRGRVLNVASTAAFVPGPLMSVYYATKAYVLSFSEALNEELRGTPVTVTTLCPGPVATGFQEASSLNESKLVSGPMKLAMLSAAEVAQIGVNAMLAGRGVVVAGAVNQAQTALMSRVLPRPVVTRLVALLQGRRT